MNGPLVPVALAFAVGILLGLNVPPYPLVVCGAAGLSAWIAWRRRRRFTQSLLALLSLWVCLGMLRMLLWQAHPDHHLRAVVPEVSSHGTFHGVVLEDPIEISRPHGMTAHACLLGLRHLDTGAGWQPRRGRMRLTWSTPEVNLASGDEVLLEGTWQRPPLPGNRGQYDWRAALARQRVHAIVTVRPFDGVVRLQRGQGRPWVAWMSHWRQRWGTLIRDTFEARDTGMLNALLLGQRRALDDELNDAFVQTGTVHLLVISGFHVGIIALLLAGVLRWLGMPWRARLLLVAIGLGAYCVLVGMRPPVVRATIMAWMVLGALALDRVINWPNVLAAAALVILWANPTQLLDPGFQLSFGAVLSLLVFVPRWRPRIEHVVGWIRPRWVRRYLAISLSCTSAIWAGLWPLLVWYFHLVAPVSMLANLLLVPLVSLVVVCGTVGLLIATVAPGLMPWTGLWLSLLLEAIVACVSWCQRLPGGFWYIGQPAWWVLLGYYGLLALTVFRHRWHGSTQRLVGGWLLAVNVLLWASVAVHHDSTRWLTVEMLDVGHGDSIVVRTPSGHTILIDAGTREAGRQRVVPFLRWAGIRTLDALIITHLDEDHLGGAIPVMEAVRVKRLLTNGAQNDTMTFRRVEELAEQRGVVREILRGGMSFGDGLGAEIQVLHPPGGLLPGVEPGSNDNSVVLQLTKGAVSFLLTGDLEEAGLPWLLAQGEDVTSAVLKVPHHGSGLGPAAEEFFAAVRPELAVISVGRAHNLPSPATLGILKQAGIRVLLTRRDGAVRIRTDGRDLEITTGRGGK